MISGYFAVRDAEKGVSEANDKHLTKVKVLSSRLVSGKVTDAFLKAGNDGGLTVKVPGHKVDDYKELFKNEGRLKGKVVSTTK